MSDAPVRTDLFDALWREILTRVEEMVDARQMTMGTVKGRDGGKVRVRLDDEDEDRALGFPRAKGVGYQTGDRVAIGYNRAGEPLVLGVVSGENDERAVGNPQLNENAVDGRVLKSGNNDGSGDITYKHLSSSVASKIQDSATVAQVDNKLSNVPSKSDVNQKADKSDLNSKAEKSEVTSLKREIDKLKKEVDNLKKKSGKKNKA